MAKYKVRVIVQSTHEVIIDDDLLPPDAIDRDLFVDWCNDPECWSDPVEPERVAILVPFSKGSSEWVHVKTRTDGKVTVLGQVTVLGHRRLFDSISHAIARLAKVD